MKKNISVLIIALTLASQAATATVLDRESAVIEEKKAEILASEQEVIRAKIIQSKPDKEGVTLYYFGYYDSKRQKMHVRCNNESTLVVKYDYNAGKETQVSVEEMIEGLGNGCVDIYRGKSGMATMIIFPIVD